MKVGAQLSKREVTQQNSRVCLAAAIRKYQERKGCVGSLKKLGGRGFSFTQRVQPSMQDQI